MHEISRKSLHRAPECLGTGTRLDPVPPHTIFRNARGAAPDIVSAWSACDAIHYATSQGSDLVKRYAVCHGRVPRSYVRGGNAAASEPRTWLRAGAANVGTAHRFWHDPCFMRGSHAGSH